MYNLKRRGGRKTFFACVCLVIVLLSAGSCKKGDPGTANVIWSEWFTPDAYIKDTVFGIWGYKYNKPAPDITQLVLDSGTVIVYGKLLGYNQLIWPTAQIAPLPISLTYIQGQTMTDTWSALSTVGNLRIRFVNDKNYWTSISTSHQFRYIVIPGAVKARTATGSNVVTRNGNVLDAGTINNITQNWEHMSYEEVCDKLGVPR